MSVHSLVGHWLQPLPIAFVLLISAALLARSRRGKLAHALSLAAAALVLLPATGVVADLLVRPLEGQHPAVLEVQGLAPMPRYVAVLASGYHPRPGLPASAALDPTGVVRLTEGLRLLRQLPPGSQLLLSGGRQRDEPPIARGYAALAAALGTPAAAIVMLEEPVDTRAEIEAIRARVGTEPVLIVSSAVHMPRVMALAAREGLHALAAPTDYLSDPGRVHLGVVPSSAALRRSEAALHEYVGLLALRLGIT